MFSFIVYLAGKQYTQSAICSVLYMGWELCLLSVYLRSRECTSMFVQCLDLFCLYNYFACMFVCVFLRNVEGARLPGVMGGYGNYGC